MLLEIAPLNSNRIPDGTGMRYESDTTDGEWLVMQPLLPHAGGKKNEIGVSGFSWALYCPTRFSADHPKFL